MPLQPQKQKEPHQGLFLLTSAKIYPMSIQVGQQAPDFILYDTDKKPVMLSAQRGKNVVLLFFPLAFTSTCTQELCGVRDEIPHFNAVDAQVFGISVDAPPSLARFKQEQGLNFPLLSDFNKEASAAWDSLYDIFNGWMLGVSKRSAFVIDKQGIIRYAEILENVGDLPDFEAINATLTSLK